MSKPHPALVSITTTPAQRRRYPGVHSFEEQDWKCFFGRAIATEQLVLRVLSVRLLLQFAPSGVGKTSLLNAGLFPELRRHNFLPFTIRLNEQKETLTQAARRSLKQAAAQSGLNEPVIDENAENLWDLLVGAQLWSHDLMLLTPVLVFDQFEEIFTLRDEAFRKRFAEEIGELSRGRATQALLNELPGRPVLDSHIPDIKIIISLREEYLGKLEELSARIPELFHERLRLAPLNSKEAEDAIVEPAKMKGDDWYSPRFEFEPQCLEALIDFIDGTSETVKIIESLTLQLVCQKGEEIAKQRSVPDGEPIQLRLEDFGGVVGLKRLVQNYFETELSELGGLGTRRRAREMFERDLLDPNGKRLMLEQDEIVRRNGLDVATLDKLVEGRLLRREPRNESIFYEISHDRLAEAISKNRKRKLPRWVKPTIAAGVAVVLLVSIFAYRANDARSQAENARSQAERALSVLLGEDLVSRLREAGLTDALQGVLGKAEIDSSSNSFALALSLRHQGDILIERATTREARAKFEASLAVLEALQAPTDGSFALLAERARTLKRIGSLMEDSGEVSQAERSYQQSLEAWKPRLQRSNPDSQEKLDACETWIRLGGVQNRMGHADAAEDSFTEALRLALDVLTAAYDRAQGGHSEVFFEQGRAMQMYAEAALSLVTVWGGEPAAQGAHALARESLRLRPLSSMARIQVGVASAHYGTEAFNNVTSNSVLVSQLYRESRGQFDELTRWDPFNLRLQRERAAVQLLISEATASCAEKPACKNTLGPTALEDAKLAALDSTGLLRMLAGLDRDNRSLNQDVVWGLQIQAKVLAALGSLDEALVLLDQAVTQGRSSVVDPADIQERLTSSNIFSQKAHLLDLRGRRLEALAALEQSLKELDPLPEPLPIVRLTRYNTVSEKIRLVKDLKRNDEANKLGEANKQLLKMMGEPWEERKKRARKDNEEGVEIHDRAANLKGEAGIAEFKLALAKYRSAIEEYPFDSVYWNNLRKGHEWISDLSKDLQAAGGGKSYAGDREAALHGALTAAWMARVLSDEKDLAESWRSLYVARMSLDQFLYGQNRMDEVLPLVAQEVLDAEEYARQQPQSAEALFFLADANVALGMLRYQSKNDGWDEAFRKGLAYGAQLTKKEPAKVQRYLWVGEWRKLRGDYLDKSDRKDAASQEYALAADACRQALALKVTEEERKKAQTCLSDLGVLNDK